MNPFVEMLDVSKEPTRGQLDDRLSDFLSEDWRSDDRMLEVSHEEYSGCLRWVKAS